MVPLVFRVGLRCATSSGVVTASAPRLVMIVVSFAIRSTLAIALVVLARGLLSVASSSASSSASAPAFAGTSIVTTTLALLLLVLLLRVIIVAALLHVWQINLFVIYIL